MSNRFSVPIDVIHDTLNRAHPITMTEAQYYRRALETVLSWLQQERPSKEPT